MDAGAEPLELSETFAPAKGTLSAPDNRNLGEKSIDEKNTQSKLGTKMLFMGEEILLR